MASVPQEDKYKYKYLIGIAVTMAAMLELIDTSIVNVAIPHMMGNLGATLDEISWVSTSYIIANVIVIPMSGWLSAYFGRRRYLTGSIMLFVAASFMCGAAGSLGSLILWRVVQGLGGGALLSTAQATLWEAFPPKEVGVGQAMFGVGVMVGPTLGPTLGGYIVDTWNWPWIFYINLPLGLIAGLLVWTYVRDAEHQEKADTVDWPGIALLTTGVGSLQWMLERGERLDWFDSRFVWALALASATSFILLVWHELRTPEPVIDFRVLRSRQLATGVAMASLLGFALFGSVFVIPVFLQGLHGFTANQTGLVILPGAIASALTMAIMGRFASKLDARPPIVVGALMFFWCMWSLSRLTFDSGGRHVLAARGSRRGTRPDLHPSHECVDGGARAVADSSGNGNVQRHPAARRLTRHRDRRDPAAAIHRAEQERAHRARHDVRRRCAGAACAPHEGDGRARHGCAGGAPDGAGRDRPDHRRPGQRARVLEDLPDERTCTLLLHSADALLAPRKGPGRGASALNVSRVSPYGEIMLTRKLAILALVVAPAILAAQGRGMGEWVVAGVAAAGERAAEAHALHQSSQPPGTSKG
ncbi:MAG TPA: DHA2 family efflux MFS transporter permease subunit [Gemmatimonadaceae bacterium]|nr:DHA2 family efflux MFS transporter permease subunit [Gemmatimonadaceae bacterium]